MSALAILVAIVLLCALVESAETGGRSGGYRPRASKARRSPPPGASAIPRRHGCYTAKRSVNPATVRVASSPSAVTRGE